MLLYFLLYLLSLSDSVSLWYAMEQLPLDVFSLMFSAPVEMLFCKQFSCLFI